MAGHKGLLFSCIADGLLASVSRSTSGLIVGSQILLFLFLMFQVFKIALKELLATLFRIKSGTFLQFSKMNSLLLQKLLIKIPFPNDDCLIWEPSKDGTLNLTDSFAMFQAPSLPVNGMKFIWKSFIPPKLSTLAWRLLHLMLPTDDALQRRGIFLVSACLLCDTLQCQESIMHVFLQCHFAQRCWRWLMNLFHTTLDFHLGIIFGIPFSTKGCLRKFQISGLWLVWWFFFSSGKLVTSCGLKTFSHPSLGFALILKQYWGESV